MPTELRKLWVPTKAGHVRGGRPFTPEAAEALLRFYAFARLRDSATTDEIAEVIRTGVQVHYVVRKVASWATYTVDGKQMRGQKGVWTWRTPAERRLLDIQNQQRIARAWPDGVPSPADQAILRDLRPASGPQPVEAIAN